MDKRRFKRIIIGFNVEMIYEGNTFRGVMENLSEAGVSIITDPVEKPVNFRSGSAAKLRFHPRDGELHSLACKIQWVNDGYPKGMIYKMGMSILNPPWNESSFFV